MRITPPASLSSLALLALLPFRQTCKHPFYTANALLPRGTELRQQLCPRSHYACFLVHALAPRVARRTLPLLAVHHHTTSCNRYKPGGFAFSQAPMHAV